MVIRKANLVSIVLFIIAILFVHIPSSVVSAPPTFWFNNAVNTSPLELGNYWTDAGQTTPAVSLPDFNIDAVHIVAGAVFNGDAIFNFDATNSGIVTGNAVFNNDSINVYPTGQINGNATFYNNAADNGIIYGDAFFHDDTIHEQANAYGDITFYDNATCSISNNFGYATFNDSSTNLGGLETNATFNDDSIAYVFINGNVIFNDNSINNSTITGDVVFNDNSENGITNITPLTNVIFNNNSINNGSIYGAAIFKDSSVNNEDVIGNATFINDLSENNVGATATTKTREYTINTTTTRNFVTDGPWTVIANAAIVNVTGATYNSSTTFTTQNGGSFIPSFSPGAGGGNLFTQEPAQGPFSLFINNNAEITDTRIVNLQIIVGSNITKMALSREPEFENVNLIPLSNQLEWDLCSLGTTCSEGVYTIFARFHTEYGQVSPIILDTIVYRPKNNSEPKENIPKEATPTIEKKNIQPGSSVRPQLFTKNLRYRNIDTEVKQLQQFLNDYNFPLRIGNRGAGSPGRETFYFGPYTRRALQRYQKAHTLPISGVLDYTTRKTINSEIEKEKK